MRVDSLKTVRITFIIFTLWHQFYFVNQQYDYLMIIAYDEVQKTYRAHLPPGSTTHGLGADFDLDYWLKEAERLCLEADDKLRNDPNRT